MTGKFLQILTSFLHVYLVEIVVRNIKTMTTKRLLDTDNFPDRKKRLPSGSCNESDEDDIEIEINDEEVNEIIGLLKNLEQNDKRREAIRAWPKEEGTTTDVCISKEEDSKKTVEDVTGVSKKSSCR